MKYYTEHTGYAGAMDCLQTIGGQLFPAKRKDGTSTVVRGKECYTFWSPDSKSYGQCGLLADNISFPHEHFTPGRIASFLLEKVVGIDPSYGTPDPVFIKLAKDGFHWHYTHVETGYHYYLLEFDLCAAYATSLGQFDSPYFSMNQQTTPNPSVMESLRVALAIVPKWMRLVMLGQMATHKMTFVTMPNRANGDYKLKWQTINKIKYGYAFNQVHRSILRVYRLLEAVHKIGGDSIKRIHTDSFTLSADCDTTIEAEIFKLLDDKGFSYSCKAQGSSHFFGLNSGIIGRKFVGVPFEIREQIRALPEKPKRVYITPEQLERWGVRGVVGDKPSEALPVERVHYEQVELKLERDTRNTKSNSRFA